MKKRRLVFVFLVISIFAFVNSISAALYLSGLEDLYNLGDMITLDITVDPIVEGRLVKTTLSCSNTNVLEFNNYPDETGKGVIKLPLNIHTINQIEGKCYFFSQYAGDTRKSDEFDISRRLNVVLHSESFFANPGDEIIISGSAKRMSGEAVNGEVEIKIPLLKQAIKSETNAETEKTETKETNTEAQESADTENKEEKETETTTTEKTTSEVSTETSVYHGRVDNGEFSIPITVADKTSAGNYRIDILVYETIAGEKARAWIKNL